GASTTSSWSTSSTCAGSFGRTSGITIAPGATSPSPGTRRPAAPSKGRSRAKSSHGGRALAFLVGFQITLVPGDPELRMGHLDDEQVVLRVRGQPLGLNLHDLIVLGTRHRYRCRRVRKAALDRVRGRYHRERELLLGRFRVPHFGDERQKNGHQKA